MYRRFLYMLMLFTYLLNASGILQAQAEQNNYELPYFPQVESISLLYDESSVVYRYIASVGFVELGTSIETFEAALRQMNIEPLSAEHSDTPVLITTYSFLPHVQLRLYGDPIYQADMYLYCPEHPQVNITISFFNKYTRWNCIQASYECVNQLCFSVEHCETSSISVELLRYCYVAYNIYLHDYAFLQHCTNLHVVEAGSITMYTEHEDGSITKLHIVGTPECVEKVSLEIVPRMSVSNCGYYPLKSDGFYTVLHIPQIVLFTRIE